MNLKPITESNALRADKRFNGLIYGALAGFCFALAAWGYDASELAAARAILPWVKFAAGALVTTLLGMLAGWLTARIDNTLVGALLWLVIGVLFSIIAGILPYQGVTLAQNLLVPEIAERTNYPLTSAAILRLWITLLTVGLSSLFIGIFELVLIDSATTSTSFLFRWLAVGACIPLALVGGYIGADIQINKPLRDPVLSVYNVLEFARANEGQVIDHDVDLRVLHGRVYARMGVIPVLLQKVTVEPAPDILVRGPRLDWRSA